MTKNEILELFAYNAWANRVIFDAVAPLPDDTYLRDLKSSHGGIHGTLAHIVWAEHLWLNRWLEKPNPAVAQGKDLHSAAEVRARWEEVEAERGRFLAGLSDAQLQETRNVKPSTGGEYQHTFVQMFQHTVDHSSYHRGQVVTLLRQVGVVPPVTGLIFFHRRG
ncbi:MAG TPA: DinB family protein [Gemmatimonadales bacterium]|nr:DinB family protein [Gemmatimonadales bacterium]